MTDQSKSDQIATEPQPTPSKTRLEKIAGPAIFAGCFVIWPATNLACSYLGFKVSENQLELARIKQIADAVTDAAFQKS